MKIAVNREITVLDYNAEEIEKIFQPISSAIDMKIKVIKYNFVQPYVYIVREERLYRIQSETFIL